ncbi:hypothetical protein F4811DRAFT_566072 [Daldinia bambusicola]|nr:hypothetical protein F4811DRAFT_566072 [Daldinia bambusicola]
MVKLEAAMEAITGTWLFINVTSYFDNGTVSRDPDPALGQSLAGMLTCNAASWMSANFMSSNPEDHAHRTLIGNHTLAYAGPWYISETTDEVEVCQITHGPTKIAWLPTWVGIELQKNYTLSKAQNGKNGEMLFRRVA